MSSITLVFPHQLFRQHPAVTKARKVYLVEESLFFQQYNFHKKKLILHRASMKAYQDFLHDKGLEVIYIETQSALSDVRLLLQHLAVEGVTQIHAAEVADNWLEKRIAETCRQQGLSVTFYTSPGFLNTIRDTEDLFTNQQRIIQTEFYKYQRVKKNILMEGNRPLGNQWTYDEENRKPFPKGEVVPLIPLPIKNKYVTEAIEYIGLHFKDNVGDTEPPFLKRDGFYPVTFIEADNWLNEFLANRFKLFGVYEDAMQKGQGLLYHSCLSCLLNIGLLTPQQVIDKALEAASNNDIPINSLEGFIRQILGWREYIRGIYHWQGGHQRTQNFWNFSRPIPKSFYNGTTGIQPLDIVIQRVLNNGYAHHIERLMVLGNFMLLCEFHPDEVYRWFMEMFIDAYDWVMVPNTYGMTQVADGGKMMTKPYISGSNYLMKMGNWEKGSWQATWDGLFWRFMHAHNNFFSKNQRLGLLLNTFYKLSIDKRNNHLQQAESFLRQLDATS